MTCAPTRAVITMGCLSAGWLLQDSATDPVGGLPSNPRDIARLVFRKSLYSFVPDGYYGSHLVGVCARDLEKPIATLNSLDTNLFACIDSHVST